MSRQNISKLLNLYQLGLHSIKGRKPLPNQDVVGYGVSTNPELLRDPKAFLKNFINEIRSDFSQKFSKSGTTLNITLLLNKKFYSLTLGDTPTIVCVEDSNGNRFSAQYTPEQSFADPEISKKFSVKDDGHGKRRHMGLEVVSLGHGALKIDSVQPVIQEFDFSKMEKKYAEYGMQGKFEKFAIVCATDGVFKSSAGDSSGSPSMPVGITYPLQKPKKGIEPALNDPDDIAQLAFAGPQKIVEKALDAGSNDDISAVTMQGKVDDLDTDNVAIVMVAGDGNGIEGHEASEDLAKEVVAKFQLSQHLGLYSFAPKQIMPPQAVQHESLSTLKTTGKSKVI